MLHNVVRRSFIVFVALLSMSLATTLHSVKAKTEIQHIVYISSGGHIQQFNSASSTWTLIDLTQLTNAPAANGHMTIYTLRRSLSNVMCPMLTVHGSYLRPSVLCSTSSMGYRWN